MAWAPGTRIGVYEIVEVLGHGGMGEVFRVRHVISDRAEAMKVLLSGSSAGTELLDRFTREIRTLAALNHPNIAALHTAFHHEQQLVMVMEFVEGVDLGRRMETGVSLPQAVSYARQVLLALGFAHERGVLHRDIKPSNIMLANTGEVKVLDFGLALSLPDARLTMTGTLVGSMHYIAPEQIAGEPHDARSDLYALGVTLYEMLTGALPFSGKSYPQVLAAHLQHTPATPSLLNPAVPEAISEVTMRALARDKRARWGSAPEFLAALEAASAGLPSMTSSGTDRSPEDTPRASSRAGRDGGASPRPGAAGAYSREQLEEITLQLASHVGPIASILVKRASSCTASLGELCALVAREIESPVARARFLASVEGGQLRR